jgi:hypothetical protein
MVGALRGAKVPLFHGTTGIKESFLPQPVSVNAVQRELTSVSHPATRAFGFW